MFKSSFQVLLTQLALPSAAHTEEQHNENHENTVNARRRSTRIRTRDCRGKIGEKKAVSTLKEEPSVDILAPAPDEAQGFNNFAELPPVKASEPPYVYICDAPTQQVRFVNEIFRKGTDSVVCSHCHQTYRNWNSFSWHYWSKCQHEKSNESEGPKILKRRRIDS